MDEKKYLDILHRVWGYPAFRGIQSDIIHSIAQGKDTLGLMPTGGGKSLTFQVPALAQEGVCIVITPLIALMKDQVENLRRRGVIAAAIYSGMSRHEIMSVLDNCILGNTKLLYVSPERIGTDVFRQKLERIKVSFITVDEAHCISQWGYDFRPSYLHIADIRQLKPNVPVLALTATATPQVVDDIQRQLGFKADNVFKMSFERKNLAYVVRQTLDKEAEMIHILKSVRGSAIVYVRSRQRTKEISQLIEQNGISSTFYHAGLEHYEKDERQRQWHDDEVRVMVATNAFGMGIDKPDVRLVLHADCPNSLEAYFQEAGRAGRDGKKAYAVLLYNGHDERKMDKRIVEEFPDKQFIRDVYEHLAYFYQIALGDGRGHTFLFDITKFCQTFHHFSIQTNSALKILQRAGYIYYDMEPDAMARVRFLLDRDDLYRLDNSSADEDAVVLALLRHYSGLFTDYSYIDENAVAYHSGLTRQQVYLILKSLSQRHIIHYIPQRKLPTITYTRDREAADRLVLSPEVYDQRREQFVHRIKVILAYATNDDVCRSRQLLRYFGETRSTDCGICDVCLGHASSDSVSDDASAAVCERILRLLSDGKRHAVSEFASSHGPHANVAFEAVAYLIGEEKICCEDGEVWIEKKK